MKKLIFMLLAIVVSNFVLAKSPYQGKTKEEYYKEIGAIEKTLTEKEKLGTKSVIKNDWGTCRDNCYNQRNQCYDLGGQSHICESHYDSCTARCDARY